VKVFSSAAEFEAGVNECKSAKRPGALHSVIITHYSLHDAF